MVIGKILEKCKDVDNIVKNYIKAALFKFSGELLEKDGLTLVASASSVTAAALYVTDNNMWYVPVILFSVGYTLIDWYGYHSCARVTPSHPLYKQISRSIYARHYLNGVKIPKAHLYDEAYWDKSIPEIVEDLKEGRLVL